MPDRPRSIVHLDLDAFCAAVEMIETLRPDVAILDIQMPGMNGFEVICPGEQSCCGLLRRRVGDVEGARRLARENILSFAETEVDAVVTACALVRPSKSLMDMKAKSVKKKWKEKRRIRRSCFMGYLVVFFDFASGYVDDEITLFDGSRLVVVR